MDITKTAFCAICQQDLDHTVSIEDNGDIKLTCPNSTLDIEHAIRMSGNVTKPEMEKILADHKTAFQNAPVDAAPETDEQKLTALFS